MQAKPNQPVGCDRQGEQNMTTQAKALAATEVQATDSATSAIIVAALAGALLLFVSGYAQATILHDAAHDQRHAMAFPCH